MRVVRVEVPLRTIATVTLALSAIWLSVRLWNVFLLLFIAFLLAAALAAPVHALERRGWRTGRAVGVVVLGLVLIIVIALLVIIPQAVREGQQVSAELPSYIDQGERFLRRYPVLEQQLQSLAERGASSGAGLSTAQAMAVGTGVVAGVVNTLFVLVMAIYLLADGERVYGWITRFLNPVQQIRVRRIMPEVVKIVSGYVAAQAITSLLFAVFAFVVLYAANVPGALLLAVLAGFMDAIPLVGVPVATIPAVLLAWTVSLPTALVVLGLYVAYQQVENYLIVPRVYGRSLQVSSISVLLAVFIGGQLLGIVGILLALPMVAAVPVIERIWHEDVREEDRLLPPVPVAETNSTPT